MKDLKNLKGAKMLSKMEQKVIKGGEPYEECYFDYDCYPLGGSFCVNGRCR